MASLDQLTSDWEELSIEYKDLEGVNNNYLELLEGLYSLQQKCTKDIQHQRYRLSQISSNLKTATMAQKEIFNLDLEELSYDDDERDLIDYEDLFSEVDYLSDEADDFNFENEDFESIFGEFRQESNKDNGDIRFDYDLEKELAIWAVQFGENHMSLTGLLKVLKKYGHKLPNEAKTLLHTPRTKIQTRPCPPGECFYFGIEKGLIQHCGEHLFSDEVVMDFFIDGASLSNCSKWNMWPLLGYGHPEDIEDYLMEFVDEMQSIKVNGVLVSHKKLRKKFKVRCYISDAPARAFLTGTMSHSSYHGCPKCTQVCNRLDGRMLYQSVCCVLRTDESFNDRRDVLHHQPEFKNRKTPLEFLGTQMVTQIVFDPMHLIDHGATPQLLTAILDNNCPNEKFGKPTKDALNARYLSFRDYVPSEFEHKPRLTGLSDVHSFKANEHRQLLLYTIPVLLKDLVSQEMYKVALKLHIAVRLLSDPVRYKDNINAARQLLTQYVAEFDGTFGIQNFKFKTHCLLHIADDVEKIGALYTFGSYKHENHLGILKHLLRKNDLALQQFYNRFEEISYVNHLKRTLFAVEDEAICKFDSFTLKPNCLRDGCCMIEPGIPLVITQLYMRNGIRFIKGRRFLECNNFYEDPLPSMEYVVQLMSTMEKLVQSKWVLPTAASIPYNSNSYKITCNSDPVVNYKNISENIQPNYAGKQYISFIKHQNVQIQEETPRSNPNPQKIVPIKKVTKSAEAKKNAGKFLVFNVKSSENVPKSNVQKRKPRKIKANYQKNILKSLKVYTAENDSTTTRSKTENDFPKINCSESMENEASTSSTVNKLVSAYGLKPTNATAISMQNAVFAEKNSNGFDLYGGSGSEESRRNQISEFATHTIGHTKDTSWFLEPTSYGQAPNTNLEEIESRHNDCYESTDHTKENEVMAKSQIGSAVVSVFNENNEVAPIETDQMTLILQELRAIKQIQEEMKKESEFVKRRQSYLMHYTKTIACKLEDVIDSEIEAFSFPFKTLESVQKIERNLNQLRYSEKLEGILRRRISTRGNVVSDLVEMVFEPEALSFFNLRGINGQPNFKELRISKLFLKISKLGVKDYESELAKVFKKMHMRHVRKSHKENIGNEEDDHMFEDENFFEEEYLEDF